ncbi:hypothetical protein BI364_02680 [Acidihalobacter yilgarnensis]|uniref:NodB homology domain-containing protein n=2 Tax=Acidihalobacter yilgarnensis TaxID=2819280 RepID=A0A1D8IKR6_9GAMM|nr:hypothetical protein BI364_02680 [Acidihalobacter yilgarnensis]
MTARAVPVLMYHHVTPRPGLVTVSPATFEAHMTRLARGGYRTITADQLLAFMKGREALPPRSVAITFDDGYLDNYVHAYPVLKRLGLHAIIFAVTGWIGDGSPRPYAGGLDDLPDCPDHRTCKRLIEADEADRAMLRWSEIEMMSADGTVEFHSHSHGHVRWDQLYPDPAVRLAALREDLERSRATLTARLGGTDRHLCWPWGYFEPEYQSLAAGLGFESQFSVIRGTNRPHDNVAAIRRIDTKERPAGWLARQLFTYRSPMRAGLYLALRR